MKTLRLIFIFILLLNSCHQECDHQRALFQWPFSGCAGHAGRVDSRGTSPGRRPVDPPQPDGGRLHRQGRQAVLSGQDRQCQILKNGGPRRPARIECRTQTQNTQYGALPGRCLRQRQAGRLRRHPLRRR